MIEPTALDPADQYRSVSCTCHDREVDQLADLVRYGFEQRAASLMLWHLDRETIAIWLGVLE